MVYAGFVYTHIYVYRMIEKLVLGRTINPFTLSRDATHQTKLLQVLANLALKLPGMKHP